MENRLSRYQISLRDGLILFFFISCVLGITITRLMAYQALHEAIRLELENCYQLEVDALVQGDTNSEKVAQAKRLIANLEQQASTHLIYTFTLLGITTVCFALALVFPRIKKWMTRK
jgi:hypothetical protein